MYPILGIVFGGIIGVFSEDDVALRAGGNRYALYAFILSLVAAVSVMLQSWAFGSSAEILSRIIRVDVFAAILKQDVSHYSLCCVLRADLLSRTSA